MKTDGQIRKILKDAMLAWDAMKVDGIGLTERVKALAATLRQSWWFTREWKYLCQSCDDTGLVISACDGDATCGRGKPHGPHTFGTPCWCSLGVKFRPKPLPNPDDVEAAGRMPKTKSFARVGR